MKKKSKFELLKNSFIDYIERLIMLYDKIENYVCIDGHKLNLSKEKVKRISIENDKDFYFQFLNEIFKYRERIKDIISLNNIEFFNYNENRIKNINSIVSKLFQYIEVKNEKGEVSINKCLNDLFGVRISVPLFRFKKMKKLVNEINEHFDSQYKVYNASKQEYKAIHFYIFKDNYTFRWEIQFWLKRHDAANRNSHAKYKQAYTSWEKTYEIKNLYRID